MHHICICIWTEILIIQLPCKVTEKSSSMWCEGGLSCDLQRDRHITHTHKEDTHIHTAAMSPTHTADMASASDNSSRAAERTKPPPGSLKVTNRQAAAETTASRPIAGLPLFGVKSSVPLLHEITLLLVWDYLPPGAKLLLKTMQMTESEAICRQIDVKKKMENPHRDQFLRVQIMFCCVLCLPVKNQLGRKTVVKRDLWFPHMHPT